MVWKKSAIQKDAEEGHHPEEKKGWADDGCELHGDSVGRPA
jgi:hypothetical protein